MLYNTIALHNTQHNTEGKRMKETKKATKKTTNRNETIDKKTFEKMKQLDLMYNCADRLFMNAFDYSFCEMNILEREMKVEKW